MNFYYDKGVYWYPQTYYTSRTIPEFWFNTLEDVMAPEVSKEKAACEDEVTSIEAVIPLEEKKDYLLIYFEETLKLKYSLKQIISLCKKVFMDLYDDNKEVSSSVLIKSFRNISTSEKYNIKTMQCLFNIADIIEIYKGMF